MADPRIAPADLLRAESAPPPAGLYLHLASPSYYAPVQGIVLSAFPFEFETHWIDPAVGPERICTRRHHPCPFCTLELRWNAAVAVRLRSNGGMRLVRISAHAARNCDSGHFRRPSKPIRGWGLTLLRHKGGRSGRLEVRLTPPPAEDPTLPPGPDVAAIVAHLLGADKPAAGNGGAQ